MKTMIMLKDTFIFLMNVMAYENGEKTRNTLEVDSDDTIYGVMAQVEKMTGVPPVLQMLDHLRRQILLPRCRRKNVSMRLAHSKPE